MRREIPTMVVWVVIVVVVVIAVIVFWRLMSAGPGGMPRPGEKPEPYKALFEEKVVKPGMPGAKPTQPGQ